MATVKLKPTDFKDLDRAELYRSAVADFALPVEEDDNKKSLLAAFVEGGVEWSDYVEQHPEVGPDPAEETDSATVTNREQEQSRPGEVVTLGTEKKGLTVGEEVPVEAPRVHVKESMAFNPADKFLIKMTRENPLFEIRGYRFTAAHPYALVSAGDVEPILSEDGFRQAYPSELQEFYG